MKRLAIFLCTFIFIVACEGAALASSTSINIVKTGRLDAHPDYTVGEAFDAFFSDVNWYTFDGADGNTYVNVSGGFTYNGNPAQGTIQFRLQEGNRFQLAAYVRDGKDQSWNALGALINSIYAEYDNMVANQRNTAVMATPVPDNGCDWCDEWWCEGSYCEKTDSWRDVVPEEHSFWGITSGETRYPGDILKEKGIAYEETSGSRLSRLYSAEDQDIIMFDLPVSLFFQYSATRPNWLTYVDINCKGSDAEEALRAYMILLAAMGERYGEPTGGYMKTGSYYGGEEWSFPMDNLDNLEEIIMTALAEEKYALLCLYNRNLGIYVSLFERDDTIVGYTWMRFHYNLPATLEERPPASADFFTFDRPNGVYTNVPKTIQIGF